MIRTFRYRLNPSRAQVALLMEWLEVTRELYNAAIQERKEAWRKQRVSVSRYDQQVQIVDIRSVRPDVSAVSVYALRGALRRAEKAFVAFFRRLKAGLNPGYPRFKPFRRWATLEFNNTLRASPVVAGGKRIAVPLVGKVKLKYHRPLEGRPRAMRITLGGDKHWYVSIVCEGVMPKVMPLTGKSVGVDLGLLTFAATSDGELFDNPRPLSVARFRVERAQRRVSRRKRGSKRRKVAACSFARLHAHVAGIRREHHIAVARSLVARFDTIYAEALNIQGLARSALAKSVHDAGWGRFLHWLRCKAESAGREVVVVAPHGTSKTCSACGCVKDSLPLSERVFRCESCDFTIDRDVNAAINIKAAGIAAQGAAPLVKGRHRSAKPAKSGLLHNTPHVEIGS